MTAMLLPNLTSRQDVHATEAVVSLTSNQSLSISRELKEEYSLAKTPNEREVASRGTEANSGGE